MSDSLSLRLPPMILLSDSVSLPQLLSQAADSKPPTRIMFLQLVFLRVLKFLQNLQQRRCLYRKRQRHAEIIPRQETPAHLPTVGRSVLWVYAWRRIYRNDDIMSQRPKCGDMSRVSTLKIDSCVFEKRAEVQMKHKVYCRWCVFLCFVIYWRDRERSRKKSEKRKEDKELRE
eukprot:g372.t1